jgi:hypothetical protein
MIHVVWPAIAERFARRAARITTLRLAVAAIVCVAQVKPRHAIVAQAPLHVLKHGDDFLDVFLGRGLKSDLAVNAVITLPVVRRRGNAALHACGVDRPQRGPTVACNYAN